MNLSLRQMKHLVVLAEEANFGRASERLGLSQPALSRSIKAVEEAYGVTLIARAHSGATLTRTGEEAVRLARTLLQNAAHLDETLRAEAGGEAGSVYAGVAPLPAGVALAAICVRVLRTRPGIRFYTDVQPNASLAELLISATYDFLLCPPLALNSLSAFDIRPAGAIPFDLIVRARHPLAGRKRVTMDEINTFPVIGAHTRAAGRQAEFDPGTSFFDLGSLRLTSDNYNALALVTQETDAIWLSSRLSAKAAIDAGRLVILPPAGLPFPATVDLAVVSLRNASLSPATLAVFDDILVVMAELTSA